MEENTVMQLAHELWFDEKISIYESLAANITNTLKTALDKNNIIYVDIPYRAKTKKSFLKKWQDKDYYSTDQMMDLAGIRVITLVEDDLEEVEQLIRQLFHVHDNESSDKSMELGHERFGYRSRHFICDIGKKREGLIELDHFKGLRFEIQIRTALAHAWAEIEHDKGYKLEGGLPSKFKRRLNIVAAMLEAADNEFNRLTQEIKDYTEQTRDQVNSDELEIEITRIAIQELLLKKHSTYINPNNFNLGIHYEDLKHELDHFNIHDIRSLDVTIQEVLTKYPQLHNSYLLEYERQTEIGFLRSILMFYNLKKYSEQPLAWHGIDMPTLELLMEVYGETTVNDFLKATQMRINTYQI